METEKQKKKKKEYTFDSSVYPSKTPTINLFAHDRTSSAALETFFSDLALVSLGYHSQAKYIFTYSNLGSIHVRPEATGFTMS